MRGSAQVRISTLVPGRIDVNASPARRAREHSRDTRCVRTHPPIRNFHPVAVGACHHRSRNQGKAGRVNTRNKIRIAAAMLFGATVAIVAITGAANVGTVAAIGGILLGLLYVATGFFGRPESARQRGRR
jgi:hypothetical protein